MALNDAVIVISGFMGHNVNKFLLFDRDSLNILLRYYFSAHKIT